MPDPVSYDIRLLSASYSKENDTVIVDLFGKTKDGTSVVARKQHAPWFQVIEPSDLCIQYIKSHDETVSVKECKLWYDGKERNAIHITAKHPWKVGGDSGFRVELEKKFKATVVACDIPFHLRFIYDYDLPACLRITGLPVTDPVAANKFSANVVVNITKFEELPPFDVPLKIMAYDIENSIKTGTKVSLTPDGASFFCGQIYCIACAIRDGNKEIEYSILSGPERDIIRDWIVFIKKNDPDVICGYNVDRYDMPQILGRAKALNIDIKAIAIGRDGSPPSPHANNQWKVHGRIMADSWWAVKRSGEKLKRETLAYVSMKLLGETKEDVNAKRIDEEWTTDKDKVMSYCRKDAELSLRILERTKVVQKAFDLGVVARFPLAEAFDARTSALIDSFLIRTSDRMGIAVPPTRESKNAEEKIEGGYVRLPTAGLYNNVITVDVRSMYPSQIIKNNICFTTLNPAGTIVSPHNPNIRYLTPDVKEGIIPALMKRLWKERDAAKKKQKQAAASKNKAEEKYYKGLQESIKVCMNATYGILASDFYRFTNPDIGATITAFSRQEIKNAAEKMQKEDKLEVLYGDTDSIFIKSPECGLIETVRVGQDIADRYSVGQVAFEFEKVMDPWYTHGAKKRYFGRLVWPPKNARLEETDDGKLRLWSPYNEAAVKQFERIPGAEWVPKEGYWLFPKSVLKDVQHITSQFYAEKEDDMLVRGYETRRTDAFELQEEALTTMFNMILDRNIPGAIDYSVTIVQQVLKGDVPYPKIAISRTVKDELLYKRADSMVNVLVSRKLKDMGETFVPGMKVSWIVTDSKKTPQEAEPYIEGRPFKFDPDWEYYAKRLAKSLSRVTELWDWDADALVRGTRQGRLYQESMGMKKPKRRRKKKPETSGTQEKLF